MKRDATEIRCNSCNITKPIKDFYPGELSACCECKKARAKAQRERKKLKLENLNDLAHLRAKQESP